MKESLLRYIKKCDKCGVSYIEEIGEVCKCHDEPDAKQDEKLLSKWQVGEVTL